MFGGVDDWTFDAATFKEELRKEHDSIWLRDPLGVSPDEGIEVEEEEEEDGEGEGLKESEPGSKQVRHAHVSCVMDVHLKDTESVESMFAAAVHYVIITLNNHLF